MRNFITNDWLTVFTLLGLLSITASKVLNTARFYDFILVTFNSKYLKIYTKERKKIDFFDSFLYLNLIISTSIFIYFTYNTFIAALAFNLILFFKLLISVFIIFSAKMQIDRFIGRVFKMQFIIDQYLFQKKTFKNYTGLLILISNLFLLYIEKLSHIVIIVSFSLILLINLIGFLTSFKTYQKSINSNFLYFLLYLCALEIGPYVILYKVIRDFNA